MSRNFQELVRSRVVPQSMEINGLCKGEGDKAPLSGKEHLMASLTRGRFGM